MLLEILVLKLTSVLVHTNEPIDVKNDWISSILQKI